MTGKDLARERFGILEGGERCLLHADGRSVFEDLACGLCYGYRVVKALSGGNVTTGEREIKPTEAAIVERIFRDFIAGVSPKQIAKNLNRGGIAGPFGGPWSPSTIYGNSKRGTGILNNELYIGRLVWNRLRYVKNPDTGKRVSRLNPESEWMRKERTFPGRPDERVSVCSVSLAQMLSKRAPSPAAFPRRIPSR